ncbi:MAG: D-alanyl transfer protein [Flavobacteriales bacterium]|nr:D-alanyl transfer protein [Flavobacteriales bacterium]
MLPFADIEFYLLFAVLVAAMYALKAIAGKRITLAQAIAGISLLYTALYYPKPLQLLLFTVYQCGLTWLLLFRWRKLHGLVGSLLLALPMVLVKLNVEVDLLGFAGISYITFRAIQVYLDGEQLRERFRFVDFIGFLLFTPSLLAGPIDRYERFKGDLDAGWSRLNGAALIAGWELILLGALHKFVLAELVDRYWLQRFDAASTMTSDMAANMYGYAVYLYFDFAGYSLLAIGLGRMMGIALPANFDRPWLTQNAPEFWRRWHISLGDWLRDYFFRPIYKQLSSTAALRAWPLLRQNIALFSTFLLMGCWNGLQAHYIASGALFGLYSVAYNSVLHRARKQRRELWAGWPSPVAKGLSILIMINLASFALYLFSGRFPYLH